MIWSEKPAAPEEFVLPRVLTVIVERRWSILACLAAGLAAAAAGYHGGSIAGGCTDSSTVMRRPSWASVAAC